MRRWCAARRRLSGSFLRLIERSTGDFIRSANVVDDPYEPRWERYLAGEMRVDGLSAAGRDWEGYLGSLGLYVGGHAASAISFTIYWAGRDNPIDQHAFWRHSVEFTWLGFLVALMASGVVVQRRIRPIARPA